MATRNVTAKFDSIRAQLHNGLTKPPNYTSTSSSRTLISSDADSETGAEELGLDASQLPPEWVDIVDDIRVALDGIEGSLATLSRLHAQRLKVSFGDSVIAEQEREIEILTEEITRLLKQCERNIKKIAVVGNNGKLSDQDRTVRLNVMRALAIDIQNHSKTFRNSQKSFLQKLREQESSGSQFGFDTHSGRVIDDDALDQGLSADQQSALDELNVNASEREQEIIKVAQSINELATLFKELNVLVIEQGTILDRIDYNVEQARAKVEAGNAELVKADEHSKKMYTIKAIICLTLVILILIIVLIVTKTNVTKSDDDKKD